MALTNYNCVEYSITPQAYKVVNIHANEISGWTSLYRLLHAKDPHLGDMIGYVWYDIVTLAFNKGQQIEKFHSRILILQQEIILSG